jgi:hypothetical protein
MMYPAQPKPPETETLGEDILWGARRIAEEIGVPTRKAYHLLENNLIPARKIGRDWCARRSVLNQHFAVSGEAA